MPHDPAPTPAPDPSSWRWYRPLVWACAAASSIVWTLGAPMPTTAELSLMLMLIALGNVADLAAVRIQAGMRVSSAHFAAPFAIIVAGVPAGLIAAACTLASRRIVHRRDWNAFDIAVNVCAASVAGAAWQLGHLAGADMALLPSLATVVAFAFMRSLINAGWAAESRARGVDIPNVTLPIGRLMLTAALLSTPAIALFGIEHTDPVTSFVLLTLPFVATQFLIQQFGRERILNEELENANVSLTESLVTALDARDPYCAGHSVAVAVYARDVASAIGLSDEDVQRTYLAGLLHDIGKIAVPDAILRKPTALTDEEFDHIKDHPVVGEQILAPSRYLSDVLPGVRHHHERIDGRGYPDRMRDEQIPLQARIIAVADAYNAMTSQRPYRDAMHPDVAQRILVQNQGMVHDPFVVSALRQVLAERGSDYALAIGPEFATTSRLQRIMNELDDHRQARYELEAPEVDADAA